VRAIAAATVCLALLPPHVSADDHGEVPRVSMTVEPATGTVGDIFTATVQIEAPTDVALSLPGRDADLGDVEVRSASRSQEELADGRRRTTLRYEFSVWEVGESTVQAPPIAWRRGDDAPQQAERPEATVSIHSVLTEGAEEIKDVRPPHEIPLRPIHYVLAAAPLLLLIGLIAGAVALIRRRRSAEEAEAPEPPLPPGAEAIRALDELERENLVGQGRLKDHYVRLSWILRHYIERRWRLPALEETTGMLAATMRGSGRVPEVHARAVVALLTRADLAKFAKHTPEHTVAREDVERAREIVTSTRHAAESDQRPLAPAEGGPAN